MRSLLHQTGSPEEMGHFLVKVHINKMDPKIRKMQADQLATKPAPLPYTGPLIVLGFWEPFSLLVLLSLSWGLGTPSPCWFSSPGSGVPGPLPRVGSPLIVLGFWDLLPCWFSSNCSGVPCPGPGKQQEQRCSGAPLQSHPTQCPHVPQPCPTQCGWSHMDY